MQHVSATALISLNFTLFITLTKQNEDNIHNRIFEHVFFVFCDVSYGRVKGMTSKLEYVIH